MSHKCIRAMLCQVFRVEQYNYGFDDAKQHDVNYSESRCSRLFSKLSGSAYAIINYGRANYSNHSYS